MWNAVSWTEGSSVLGGVRTMRSASYVNVSNSFTLYLHLWRYSCQQKIIERMWHETSWSMCFHHHSICCDIQLMKFKYEIHGFVGKEVNCLILYEWKDVIPPGVICKHFVWILFSLLLLILLFCCYKHIVVRSIQQYSLCTVCSWNYVFQQSWLTWRYMTCKFLGFSSAVVEVFVLPGCGATSMGNRFPLLSDHYIVLEPTAVN